MYTSPVVRLGLRVVRLGLRVDDMAGNERLL